jgi:hypothetical protein
MRKESSLIRLARGLIDLLAEEAARNPDFSRKLDSLLEPTTEKRPKKEQSPKEGLNVPDIYSEWRARGETEFRLWLRDQPVAVLRTLIREHDLDAARRTEKWREAEKLSAYISDQLQGRLKTGSSFLTPVRPHQGLTLAIAKDSDGFDACIMLSHVGERGNELSQLFRGKVTFADALKMAQQLSDQKGLESLYQIDDETTAQGTETFSSTEDWDSTLREIDRQLVPLKERSGLNWASGQPITSRDLARALPVGPQIERLMALRASVFKRKPVVL